jgi:hygromycin-B 7''-O-kinase
VALTAQSLPSALASECARYTARVELPRDIAPAEFYARLQPTFEAWRPAVEEVVREHGLSLLPLERSADGSNLVAFVGERWVVKLFPPFHRHQWESEHRVLPHFAGRVRLAVPELVAAGERTDGFTFVVMTRLPGTSLESRWSRCTRVQRVSLMRQIGATMASAQRLTVGALANLPPRWPEFLQAQRAGCRARHTRLGMPSWIVDAIDGFVAEALPALPLSAEHVVLTGEYTPFNLWVEEARGGPRLSGMLDFGDAMVGPPVYDLLGPATFLAAGDELLMRALIEAHGHLTWPLEPSMRRGLLALLLLHRYSNLDVQVRVADWRTRASSLDELAELIWPMQSS